MLIRHAWRVLQRHWTVYTKLYKTSFALNFVEPVLYLVAMGMGLGIFVQDINLRTGPVPRTGAGRFEKLEGLRVSDSHLEASSKLFDLLNSGIRGCRIPKGALPRN